MTTYDVLRSDLHVLHGAPTVMLHLRDFGTQKRWPRRIRMSFNGVELMLQVVAMANIHGFLSVRTIALPGTALDALEALPQTATLAVEELDPRGSLRFEGGP